MTISIHAPSRERLSLGRGRGSRGSISIHAPSRERRSYQVITINFNNFNPRSLTGATYLRYDKDTDRLISIHAPSRERPASKPPTTPFAIISIHAPSRERLKLCDCLPDVGKFQSTLPHGSDLTYEQVNSDPVIFQSTLPHGSDQHTQRRTSFHFRFQSTLPHGSD